MVNSSRFSFRPALLISFVLILFAASACVPAPPPPPRIFIYGDSLTAESVSHISSSLKVKYPDHVITIRSLGGSAQCDWNNAMRDDAAAGGTVAVIIAFFGNRFSPCSLTRPYPQSYNSDAHWAAALWAGHNVPVAFIGTPPVVGTSVGPVSEQYRAAAASTAAIFVDAAPPFADPATGLAAARLPCLPAETAAQGCAGGTINVRNPDKLHLCPQATVGSTCPVYSSGEVRYAKVLTNAVDQMLAPVAVK